MKFRDANEVYAHRYLIIMQICAGCFVDPSWSQRNEALHLEPKDVDSCNKEGNAMHAQVRNYPQLP